MPQLLAVQGVNGGATERANARMWNDYQRSKDTVQAGYNRSVSDLDTDYATNVSGVNARYSSLYGDMMRERGTDALNYANTIYNAAFGEQEARRAAEQWQASQNFAREQDAWNRQFQQQQFDWQKDFSQKEHD